MGGWSAAVHITDYGKALLTEGIARLVCGIALRRRSIGH